MDSNQQRSEAKIVVIGAGLAGLGAAHDLLNKHGFSDVTVLDALDRIGGRVHAIKYQDGYIQMGAEFLHASSNPICEVIRKLDLLENDWVSKKFDNQKELFLTEGGNKLRSQTVDKFFDFAEAVEEQLYKEGLKGLHKGESIGKLTRERLMRLSSDAVPQDSPSAKDKDSVKTKKLSHKIEPAVLEGLISNLQQNIESDNGMDDWGKAEIRQYTHYGEWYEHEDTLLNRIGYKGVLDYIMARIPAHVIKLEHEVTAVDYTAAHRVVIHMKGGTEIECDHVIVTVPLGYLKKHEERLFVPKLPEKKRNAIRTIGMGTMNKLFFRFEKRWWDSDFQSLNFIRTLPSSSQNETPLEQMFWGIYCHNSFKHTLCTFIAGRYATALETATDDQIIRAFMRVLRKYTLRSDIPQPAQIIRTSWSSNPYFLGSYSYYTVEAHTAGATMEDIAEPISVKGDNGHLIPRVLFAGEATQARRFQTTHGAYMSGQREARRLATFYSNSRRSCCIP